MPQYTGQALSDFIILIAGQLFIAVLAIRGFSAYAKAEWGALIAYILGGIPVAIAVYKPDLMVKFLVAIGEMFFNSGAA